MLQPEVFNLNDEVAFEPTPAALAAIHNFHENLCRGLTGPALDLVRAAYPKPGKDGLMRMELWRMMQLLGPHTLMGGPQLVVDCRIEIRRRQ